MTSLNELMDMSGRVAWVTGGAGHVGSVAAETYLELGAEVVLLDCDEGRLEETRTGLMARFSQEIFCVSCDLELESSWKPAVVAAAQNRGQVDVLVNCAAFVGTSQLPGWATTFEEQSLETWRRALEVNLTAPFGVAQTLAGYMRTDGRSGSIINVSSLYGIVGPDPQLYVGLGMGNPAAYAASKAGLLQLTRWLATTLAPSIRVNAIAPGGLARLQHPEFVRRYESRTPLGRMGTETDLKGAFAYFGSELSSYVTGQTLVVDGGWTAW